MNLDVIFNSYRNELIKYMSKNWMSVSRLAPRVGMSHQVLSRFLRRNADIDPKCTRKIEKFLMSLRESNSTNTTELSK